jgi:hypothetical protein
MTVYGRDRAYPNVPDTVSTLKVTKACSYIGIGMWENHKVYCGDAIRIKAFDQFSGIRFGSRSDNDDLTVRAT